MAAALLRLISVLLMGRVLARFMNGLLVGMVEPEGGAVDMVRDRVCNTFVPRRRALRLTVAGRDEFFCSPACRDRALRLLPAP